MTDGSCSWVPVLTLPLGHIGSIYSLLVVTLYQQSNLKPQFLDYRINSEIYRRQELSTFREHLGSPRFLAGPCCSSFQFSVFCSVFMLCLSSFSVLCAQCCQCLWIVFVLCLVCPMLSVSLDCLRSLSCMPNVVSVSGLSSFSVLCAQCCQCLWIVLY